MVILILLFIVLCLLLAGAYFRFSKDLFSPSILFIAVYVISVLVAIINISVWHADITVTTAVVIFCGVGAFFVGSAFAYRVHKGHTIKAIHYEKKTYRLIGVNLSFYIVSVAFFLALIYLYSNYVESAIQSAVQQNADSTTLELYRNEMISGDVQEPTYIAMMKTIGGALATFYLLIFINNYVGGVRRFRLLLPVVLYGVILVLSSGRIGFIYLIVATLIFLYLSQIRIGKKINGNKFIRFSVVGLVAFLALFLGLGTLTNKTQQQDDLLQNLSVYVGSSVIALDDYLNNPNKSIVDPGTETLLGVSNLLQRAGADIENDKGRFLEFRYVGSSSTRTNIYTSLRRLIHDYGYYGMLIIQLISGYLITLFYVSIRRGVFKNKYFVMLLYAILVQYITLSSIDERIVLNTFTVSTVVTIMVYFVLTRYVLKTLTTSAKERMKV